MGREKIWSGVQLLHSWLMTRRITIKLRLTGKSRLISNFTFLESVVGSIMKS